MTNPLLALAIAVALALLVAGLLLPRRGLMARWRRAQQMSAIVYREDALKHIHKLELRNERPTLQSIAGALQLSLDKAAALVTDMEAAGLLCIDSGAPRLTDEGRLAAIHIIRAHRLWEQYLAEETGYTEADWHDMAEQREHALSDAELARLSARLGHPTHDPHGDPIPGADGEFVPHGGQPLSLLAPDQPARIVHLEDEPESIYAQLVAEGLAPGMKVRVATATPERVRFWVNGDEHVLAPVVAANVYVRPLPDQNDGWQAEGIQLSDLPLGESGEVLALSTALRGHERRRLLDLGLLPGTRVTAELRSPSGDPRAYRIRGAAIALRDVQARHVKVKALTNDE